MQRGDESLRSPPFSPQTDSLVGCLVVVAQAKGNFHPCEVAQATAEASTEPACDSQACDESGAGYNRDNGTHPSIRQEKYRGLWRASLAYA